MEGTEEEMNVESIFNLLNSTMGLFIPLSA